MRRPSAIVHMTVYGLIYNFLLWMLFICGDLLLTSFGERTSDLFGIVLSIAYFAFMFGGLPGAVLGFIEGGILWLLTRSIQQSLIESEISTRRNVAFGLVSGLTFVGMGAWMELMFGGDIIDFFIIAPPFIVAFAAVYTAHRYFLKLRAWGSVGKVKNKAKHDLTNQLAYKDEPVENHIPAEEAQNTRYQ